MTTTLGAGAYVDVAGYTRVTGSADSTHLTLAAPGTRFAHAPGVSVSQAGAAGSLAELLLRASAWIEGYCRQGALATDRSLFALSRGERWELPGTRALLDRDAALTVRPGHFPVQSVASLAIELGQGQSLALDVSQVELPADGRLIEAPYLLATPPVQGQSPLLETLGLSRARRQWVTLTYAGGIPIGGVPYDLQQAYIWVASDLLAVRRNPSGAALVRQGKFELQARPRADTSGESILLT
jgi:hypothetical protein